VRAGLRVERDGPGCGGRGRGLGSALRLLPPADCTPADYTPADYTPADKPVPSPPPRAEVPDPGTLMDMYGNSGIDFIVDTGPRVTTATTVVDLTGPEPELVRQGAGDASALVG
jgi:hypothetical protein